MSSPSRSWLAKASIALAVGLIATFAPIPALTFAAVPVLERLPVDGTAVAGAQTRDHDHDHGDLDGDRVLDSALNVEEFSTVGVLLDGAPSEPVMVRTRSVDGNWSDWRELAVELDEGPDADSAEAAAAGAVAATEPIWVADAVGYELTMAATDADGAQVALVREEQRRVVTEATPLADAAMPRAFDIATRAAWGAQAVSSVSYGSTIDLAVVHHSVSSNSYSQAEVPGVIRGIQAYHMGGRGWSDIGYNFVVDRFGGVWEGRAGSLDGPTIGAHAAGFNTNSVGVVVLGDYTSATPSSAAVESVSRVVGWKLASHGTNPVGTVTRTAGTGSTRYAPGTTVQIPRVVGHGDVGSTSCPGSVRNSLGAIRPRAQEWAEWSWAASRPIGSLDAVGVGPGQVVATGWAADPDASAPMSVRMTVGSATVTGQSSIERPDVAALYPFAGSRAGFQVVANGVAPGYQDMCVTLVNQNFGLGDESLGCRPVVVPDPSGRAPTGSVDEASGFTGGFTMSGTYAIAAPGSVTQVGVEVDGTVSRWVTPSNNRFSARVVGVTAGTKRVCAVARSSFGTDTRINCRLVEVGGAAAIGSVDRIEYADGRIHVAGWALDPESTGAIPVGIAIGATRETQLATLPRADVAAAHPGYGAEHGFAASAPVGPGSHQVCVAFGAVGEGPSVLARCEQVIVK